MSIAFLCAWILAKANIRNHWALFVKLQKKACSFEVWTQQMNSTEQHGSTPTLTLATIRNCSHSSETSESEHSERKCITRNHWNATVRNTIQAAFPQQKISHSIRLQSRQAFVHSFSSSVCTPYGASAAWLHTDGLELVTCADFNGRTSGTFPVWSLTAILERSM